MTGTMQRSLALMKKEGYLVAIAEHFNPWGRVRVDLFGFIDICAIKPEVNGVVAVQTTSKSNVSARLTKILPKKEVKVWLQAGNDIEIHGWVKQKGRWEVDRRQIKMEDLL